MFNVPALLLDDALLKCVVTEVVLFSIVAFKTLDISQGSVAKQLRCGEISLSLQIFSWFWEWNNYENRLIFGKVKAYKKLCHFLDHLSAEILSTATLRFLLYTPSLHRWHGTLKRGFDCKEMQKVENAGLKMGECEIKVKGLVLELYVTRFARLSRPRYQNRSV